MYSTCTVQLKAYFLSFDAKSHYRMARRTTGTLRNGVYSRMWHDRLYTSQYTLFIKSVSQGPLNASTTLSKMIADQLQPDDAGMTMDFVEDGRHHVVIVLVDNPTPGLIAHEANHALNMVFKHHGMKLDVDNDEHQSYCLDWLVNELHYSLECYRKKLK